MAVTRSAAPLWILAGIAVALLLREGRDLFVPIAIAALLTFALAPAVRQLQRLRLPRTAAAAVLLGTITAGAVWGAYAMGDDIVETIQQLPRTARELRERMQEGGGSLLERINKAARELRQVGDRGSGAPAAAVAPAGAASSALWTGSAGALAFLGNLVVVVFLVFFFLATGATYRPRLIALLGPHLSGTREAADVLDEITAQIERFILVRLATAVLVGIATWIALVAFGAPQPALWAALAALFNSIPYFGPIIVSGGLFVVGLLANGFAFGAELGGVAMVITTIEGWLITPPLLGKAARMHTLAVFVGLLVWSWIWGIWGTILAVPMLAAVKVIADHVPKLRPLSLLLRE